MNHLLRTRAKWPVRLVLPSLAAAMMIGCGRGPQVSTANRAIVVSLATAVSTREAQWLDSNAELIEKQRALGKCTDAEYAAFQEIIAKGRAGDWTAAEAAAYALRDAQEPTTEDVKNLAERKPSSDHRGLTKSRVGGVGKP